MDQYCVDQYCYAIGPIDDWELATELDDFLDTIGHGAYWDRVEMLYSMAKLLARKHGWEGDMSQGPYVIGIPPADGQPNFVPIFVWKQGNNGTTFVVSPYSLPWLSGY